MDAQEAFEEWWKSWSGRFGSQKNHAKSGWLAAWTEATRREREAWQELFAAAKETSRMIDALAGCSMGSLHPNDLANQLLKMAIKKAAALDAPGEG